MSDRWTNVNCWSRYNRIKPTRPPEPPRKVKEKEKESNLIWRQPPTYALNAPVSAVPPSAAPVLTTWALNPHTKGNQAVSDPTRRAWNAFSHIQSWCQHPNQVQSLMLWILTLWLLNQNHNRKQKDDDGTDVDTETAQIGRAHV